MRKVTVNGPPSGPVTLMLLFKVEFKLRWACTAAAVVPAPLVFSITLALGVPVTTAGTSDDTSLVARALLYVIVSVEPVVPLTVTLPRRAGMLFR